MGKDPGLLFGAIALQSGYLTRERLDALLEEQAKDPTPLPLGELCLRRGALSANQVRRILELQKAVELTEEDQRLGTLAVKSGFAREEDVQMALEAQKKEGPADKAAAERLGEILLAMGTLSSQRLKALLAAQARLRDGTMPDEDDLGTETKELPAFPAAPERIAEEPRAWLIHDGDAGRPETFALGRFATLGRMPSHEIPVPDMGSSRTHARIEYSEETQRHILSDLDSRNGTFVNGERIKAPLPLVSGDVIRIGESVFRYAGGSGIAAEPAAPSPAPQEPPALEGPAPSKISAAMGALRRLATKIAPGIHPLRQLFALVAWIGMIAVFLPWTRRADGASTHGIQGVGIVALILFTATLVLALVGDRSRSPGGRQVLGILASSGLAALIGIARLVLLARDPLTSGRIGLYIATLAGASIALLIWVRRRPEEPSPLPDAKVLWGKVKGAAARAGETTVRMFEGVTGKRARERADVVRQRDELLRAIGEAARRAGIAGDENETVTRAEKELEGAKRRHEKTDPNLKARESVLAGHALKNAEIRLERSLQRLGRSVIDRGVPLEDERSRIAEVLLLDQRVKDLG